MGHAVDMGMLAVDIAAVLSDDHGIDVDSNDVLTALPPFLDALYALQAERKAASEFDATETALQLLELQRQGNRTAMDEIRSRLTSDQREQVSQLIIAHLTDRMVDDIEEELR